MKLGYNTNGLAHHRLVDAIELLADEGYESVAITLDAGALDPYDEPATLARQIAAVRSALDRRNLSRVIETGARYLLNPRVKHDPTLMDPDPARRAVRADFLHRAIHVGEALGAEAISLWSGRAGEPINEDALMQRLAGELRPLLDHAQRAGIPLGFEPEPGMFIDTLDKFARLDQLICDPLFQLTVDLGHVHCQNEGDIPSLLLRFGSRIVNVHIEDMIREVHEHLMFGEGTMSFPPICRALGEIGYRGGVHVELSRHSHQGAEAVRAAAGFLRRSSSAGRGWFREPTGISNGSVASDAAPGTAVSQAQAFKCRRELPPARDLISEPQSVPFPGWGRADSVRTQPRRPGLVRT